MKMHKYQNEIRLTSKVRTAVAIILAFVCPILWIGAAIDLLDSGQSQIDWYDVLILLVLLVVYLYWIFTKFRSTDLRYEIDFDEEGISEKRYIGKEKKILWERFSEYRCEAAPSPYRAGMKFFRVIFVSNDKRNPTVIKTAAFPESKLHIFKDDIFPFCDAFMNNWERWRRIQESKERGTVKIKIPRHDMYERLPQFLPPRAKIKKGDGTTVWAGWRGETAIFVINEPTDVTIRMGRFVYPFSGRVMPGRNYSCVQDKSGPHWKAVYRLCDDEITSLIDLVKK